MTAARSYLLRPRYPQIHRHVFHNYYSFSLFEGGFISPLGPLRGSAGAPLLAGLRPPLTPPGAMAGAGHGSDASLRPRWGPASDRGRSVAMAEPVEFGIEITHDRGKARCRELHRRTSLRRRITPSSTTHRPAETISQVAWDVQMGGPRSQTCSRYASTAKSKRAGRGLMPAAKRMCSVSSSRGSSGTNTTSPSRPRVSNTR